MALHGHEYSPRRQGKVDLLSPPETACFLGDDLKRILIYRRILQPANAVEDKVMCLV